MKDGTLYIIGAIIIFLAWQFGIFTEFAIVPIQTNQFDSYTNVVREGTYCDIPSFWTNNNLLSSTTSIIPTLESTFKFETTTSNSRGIFECMGVPSGLNIQQTFIDDDSCQHWSYTTTKIIDGTCHEWCSSLGTTTQSMRFKSACGPIECCPVWCYQLTVPDQDISDYGGLKITGTETGCFYSTKVYKDNQLIDEIDTTGSSLFKSYSDDGNVYGYDLPADKSGLEVSFGEQLFYTPSCIDSLKCQAKNYYRMYLLSDDITIDVSSPQAVYLEGELVEINVDIINNFNTNFIGTLEIKYEVPTIIGTKEKIETYTNLNINSGSNQFTYTIPTDIRTESLDITPTIKIYQPTNSYSGINVLQGFEEFGTNRGPITAHPLIRVYTFTEATKTIRIKSEAQSLREEINLLEGDIDALQALLNQKAQILNDLQLTLQEQLDIIDQYELLLDEKIYLVSQLELELNEQAELILQLSSISSEQAQYISALELSVSQQADIIDDMELTVNQQRTIIQNLNLTIIQQGQLINDLNENIATKAQIISGLQLTIEEQTIIISQMQLTVSQQADLINALKLTITEQAEIIDGLNLNIQQQAQIINDLNLNLAQKAALISQLQITNQEQLELIEAMNLSFAEQQEIIDQLNLLVSDDAQKILDLQLTVSEQADYINQLGLTVSQQAILIQQLSLGKEELAQLISQLELTVSQQAEMINQLQLTIEDDTRIINELNLNLEQQAQLVNELELSNQQMAQLINEFQLTIEEQAVIISNLERTVEEKAEIIALLNLSLEEEADLIDRLQLTIDEQIDLIDALNLSFEEEQALIDQLNLTIEQQQSIINGLKEKDEFDLNKFWDEYKLYIIIIGGLLLVLAFGGKRR